MKSLPRLLIPFSPHRMARKTFWCKGCDRVLEGREAAVAHVGSEHTFAEPGSAVETPRGKRRAGAGQGAGPGAKRSRVASLDFQPVVHQILPFPCKVTLLTPET